MKHFLLLLLLLPTMLAGRDISVNADNFPAERVFKDVMAQSGKNYVYPAGLLDSLRVTVHARREPLKKVLKKMFSNTYIEYSIRGDEVTLRHRPRRRLARPVALPGDTAIVTHPLDEVLVLSRLNALPTESAELGARKITAKDIIKTPTLFGEADVIKALHMQPGVTEGYEGLAGMYVHGGNDDENLYMLDNVPLYQVNHFAGLFSAFNAENIRYIDFFKSSIPAKYDGRLSSFLDVRTKTGSVDGHHGSVKLGLTSGALNIDGPLGRATTYSLALRRSWYDLLTIPMMALVNHYESPNKTRFKYSFTDLNAKVSHRFNDRTSGFVSVYYGEDRLTTGSIEGKDDYYINMDDDKYHMRWGNMVAQTGLNYRFSPSTTAEFTAAYTRFFSLMKHDEIYIDRDININPGDNNHDKFRTETHNRTSNNVSDWILRADFDWAAADEMRVRYGAGFTLHDFRPASTRLLTIVQGEKIEKTRHGIDYLAGEWNAYLEDDWKVNDRLRVNGGLHASLFHVGGRTLHGLSPRLSANWQLLPSLSLKGAFSHTTQYIHRLSSSYLSLPTDQWIPVLDGMKPQQADKVSLGTAWVSPSRAWEATVEGYWKKMHNLVEYRDDYFMFPPVEGLSSQLTTGRGSAKGIDFKLERLSGRLTGHIAYSLAWADRTFADKNHGLTYPAIFDNRHTINILLNWRLSRRVHLSAAWTGHSGNRFTLLTQQWEMPPVPGNYWQHEAAYQAPLNNYQLPFAHRLDLSCTVTNSRGYWTFGLYNAYNHQTTVAIIKSTVTKYKTITSPQGSYLVQEEIPVFKKVKMLPIIPSISYTWQF